MRVVIDRSSLAKHLLPWVLLVAAAVFPFMETLGQELVWDDHYIVAHVEDLSRNGGLPEVVSAPFFPHPGVPNEYYRPVVYLSFWLDGQLGRGSARWFHLTNVLLHAGCTLLCAVLLRNLIPDAFAAFGGSLLFALHPVHVESVAFVSGRTDLIAAAFTLIAILAWISSRAADKPIGKRAALIGASALAFLAASLSKENAVLLPILLVVWDLRTSNDRSLPNTGWWNRNAPWLVVYGLALLVLSILRYVTLMPTPRDPVPFTDMGSLLLDEPGLAALGLLRMLQMLILPWPHNALFTREHLAPDVISVLAGGAMCALMLWLTVRSSDHYKQLGVFWVVVFLAPALLVPTDGIVVIAERYLYLPSIGFCLVAGRFLLGLPRPGRRLRAVVTVAAIFTAFALGGASFSRTRVWRNDLVLGADLVRTSPASALAHDRLGQGLLRAERYWEAFESFNKAVSLEPLNPGYHNDLGIALRRLKQPALASEAFRRSLQLDPNAVGTRLNLAYACITLGDVGCVEEQRKVLAALDQEALAELERVLRQWQR